VKKLIKGSWYNMPGKGSFIYCGLSERKNLAVLRPLDSPLSATYMHPDYAKTLRLLRNQPHELPALILNNRARLEAPEIMFFENDSGIHCGVIESISGDICSLKVNEIARNLHLRHLFSYDNLYQQVQERAIHGFALQGENHGNSQRKIPNHGGCALA
jgi:hypothetical protein